MQVFSSTVRWDTFSPMASDFASTFYVAKVDFFLPTTVIGAVGSNGVVGPTQWNLGMTWTLPIKDNPGGIGVSQDNAILYYTGITPGTPIKRWDLIGNVALADLVAGVAGVQWQLDLIVVPTTTTFLVMTSTDSGASLYEVRLYDAVAGTLLRTYPLVLNPDFSDPRIALDLASPSTLFWIRSFPDLSGATTTFSQLSIATGAVLTTFTVPNDSSDPTKIPLSCPFFAWGVTGPVGVPGCFPGDFNGTPSLQACLPTGISGV